MIEWSNKLIVGDDAIDEDHKTLFRILLCLRDSVADSSKYETIGLFLSELSDYARYHFAREEIFMYVSRYHNSEKHIGEHYSFTAKLHNIIYMYEKNHVGVIEETIDFLSEWFSYHIGRYDMELAHYITKRKAYVGGFIDRTDEFVNESSIETTENNGGNSAELLSDAMNTCVKDGIVLFDRDGRVAFANAVARKILGSDYQSALVNIVRSKVTNKTPEDVITSISGISGEADGLCDQYNGNQYSLKDGKGHVYITKTVLPNGGTCLTIKNSEEDIIIREQTRRSGKAAVISLAILAEYRDQTTGHHLYRVSRMSHEIAVRAYDHGLYSTELTVDIRDQMGVASVLHDVGKVIVPDDILMKPGKLNPDERKVIEQHSSSGAALLRRASQLLEGTSDMALGAIICQHHHERWDGQGYPNKIKGYDIPVAARIVSIADVYDALTTERPYKKAWSEDEGISFIKNNAGLMFDPLLVDVFLEVIRGRQAVTFVRWIQEMTVGDLSLDDDHRILINLINQVVVANRRRDRYGVGDVLDELLDYTIYHFEKEEIYMAEIGYPGLEEHKNTHEIMRRQVLEIRNDFFSKLRLDIGNEIVEFLSSWLYRHIKTADQKYFLYKNARSP